MALASFPNVKPELKDTSSIAFWTPHGAILEVIWGWHPRLQIELKHPKPKPSPKVPKKRRKKLKHRALSVCSFPHSVVTMMGMVPIDKSRAKDGALICFLPRLASGWRFLVAVATLASVPQLITLINSRGTGANWTTERQHHRLLIDFFTVLPSLKQAIIYPADLCLCRASFPPPTHVVLTARSWDLQHFLRFFFELELNLERKGRAGIDSLPLP